MDGWVGIYILYNKPPVILLRWVALCTFGWVGSTLGLALGLGVGGKA